MGRQSTFIVVILCVAVVLSSICLVFLNFGHDAHCTDNDCVQCAVMHHLIKIVKQLAVCSIFGLGVFAHCKSCVTLLYSVKRQASIVTPISLCVQANC